MFVIMLCETIFNLRDKLEESIISDEECETFEHTKLRMGECDLVTCQHGGH